MQALFLHPSYLIYTYICLYMSFGRVFKGKGFKYLALLDEWCYYYLMFPGSHWNKPFLNSYNQRIFLELF